MVPATAAVVLIAFGIWYSQRDTPEKVEKLLAQAYTEQRTMEMRWPGAEWAKPDVKLGSSEPLFSKPRSLFKAEDIIKEHENPPSKGAEWIGVRAQSEILEGHPQAAIDLLTPATRADPDSVPLLLNLALAYSQRSKGQNPSDSLTTIDLLSRVLKKEPENRTALFNLAIAYGHSQMWDQAVATWERYLLLDPAGPWAGEAEEKLKAAKDKLNHSLQYPPFPPADVTSFLNLTDAEIAFRFEQYQEIALRDWLVKAVMAPQSPEHEALARLAQVFAQISSDLWWRDFLDHASSTGPSGAESLSAAFVDNTKGHYADAMEESSRAMRTFVMQGNLPGQLRARYESVYAQRRLLNGKACLARADPLQVQLSETSYSWLKSQLDMEAAICLNYIDKLKDSDIALSRSLSLAQKSNLPVAVLRNIGFAQSLNNQQGRFATALDKGTEGLRDYWPGPPSTERVYQFYVGFSRTAQQLGLWAAAEAFIRHAIDLLQAEEDDIQKGAAWIELSKVLAAEKDNDAAEAAALKANRLFDGQSMEPTSRSYRLIGKMGLAELLLRHGKAQEALATLEPARALLSEIDGYFVSLNFYRLSGNINLALASAAADRDRVQRLDLAASAYQQAILIAEQALPELETDRKRLDWISGSEDAYRGLVRVFIEQHHPEDAWKLWEWYISRSYPEELLAAARKSQAPAGWPALWATISAIPRQSGPATRVVYSLFDDGMEIWTTAHDQLKATWISVGREDLLRLVQQFSQACARKDSALPEVQKLGQDLFALFVQPVNADMPAMSLILIELDRSLSSIPLEALRSPNGWYFGEKYPIVQSPGMLYERHLRPAMNLSPNTSFLLADAAASYLPGHDLELSTLQRLFPKLKVLGPKADSAAILAALRQNAAFGFIGHAEPYATGAALRISPNLLLKAEDFAPQTLGHLQLAVLAACSTGSSGNDGLLDNRSLAHAFLAGGVPGVVASRWNVDSKATAVLISDFYTQLAGHEPPPAALFSARNQLLKTYPHPYFWAGFSVTGKAN